MLAYNAGDCDGKDGTGGASASPGLLPCARFVFRWAKVGRKPEGGGRRVGTFAGEGVLDLVCSIEL